MLPYTRLPPHMHSLPHQNGALVTTDEPPLTHHYQPSPYFKSRLTPIFIHFVNLDECIMTEIHHCGIMQSSFTALKIPCSTIHPSQSPTPGNYHFFFFFCGSTGKESACNAGDLGSIPGLERSPGEGGLPAPVFWPGEFHGLYSPWGCKESDTTERLSLSPQFYLFQNVT